MKLLKPHILSEVYLEEKLKMSIISHLDAHPIANYLTILCNSFTVEERLDASEVKHSRHFLNLPRF